MKTVFIAIIVLLVASVAFAGDTTVNLTSPAVVNGTKVPPGQYILRYTIQGKTADIKLMQKEKTVATATGTVVKSSEKVPYDGVVRVNNGDGTTVLKEIHLANKKEIIQIDNAAAVGK